MILIEIKLKYEGQLRTTLQKFKTNNYFVKKIEIQGYS
jgi:hypothetical protein